MTPRYRKSFTPAPAASISALSASSFALSYRATQREKTASASAKRCWPICVAATIIPALLRKQSSFCEALG